MNFRYPLYVLLILLSYTSFSQSSLLQSGPMVGYSEMLEVMLWAQTTEEAQVYIKYWDAANPDVVYKTRSVQTWKESAYTAHLLADEVTPGNTYNYELYINNQKVVRPYPLQFQSQELWQYRTDPPTFSFAIGSCMYVNEARYDRPGTPYGKSNAIFNEIYEDNPDFMVWLGDNIYLREVDFNSMTGIHHRYTHMRAIPEIQPLMGSIHHYAIWDDHDYGPNDSDKGYWGKKMTEKAFKQFWANPNYDVAGIGGITGTFFWGDCQFFMLDNRYHRDPHTGPDSKIIGKEQMEWLFDALEYSKAQYKFICIGGQFLSNAALYENHALFADERNEIIQFLDDRNIHGVIFLTGDRHSSEITRMQTRDGDVFYDVTCSALTSTTYDHSKEPNTYRVDGSMIGVNNYAILTVSGKYRERSLSIVFRDVEGNDLYSYTFDIPPYRRR